METKINKGDVLILELTGKTASNNSIFETTDEKIAKENGIWSKEQKYGPKVVIAGNGMMIQGLEETIPTLKIGEEKEIKINFTKAFGPRDQNLLRIISIKEFEKANIKPTKGMVVVLDGILAIVKSVNSGRVMLDFNHPLAGQDLIYKIKLLNVINKEEEKCTVLAKEFDAEIKILKNENSKQSVFVKKIDQKKKNSFLLALKAAIGNWAEIKFED